jgi:hypothetical protein
MQTFSGGLPVHGVEEKSASLLLLALPLILLTSCGNDLGTGEAREIAEKHGKVITEIFERMEKMIPELENRYAKAATGTEKERTEKILSTADQETLFGFIENRGDYRQITAIFEHGSSSRVGLSMLPESMMVTQYGTPVEVGDVDSEVTVSLGKQITSDDSGPEFILIQAKKSLDKAWSGEIRIRILRNEKE